MSMTEAEINQYLVETGALLTGHFQLRSELHSDHYFQSALLLQHTLIAEKFCMELADRMKRRLAEKDDDYSVDVVISPAVGGLIVGQEIGRALGTRAIFAEKDEQSNLILRRGFTLRPGECVLVAEDVVNKGGRVQQTINLVRSYGAIPVGVAVIVDRSEGMVDFGVPMVSLITNLKMETFDPLQCPLCKKGMPVEHPCTK